MLWDSAERGFPGSHQLAKQLKTRRGAAEASRDVKQVAGTGARSKESPVTRNGADQNDIGQGEGGLGEIATGERGAVGLCQGQKTCEEAVDPGVMPAGGAPPMWLREFAR
jgi:hypothetical protein